MTKKILLLFIISASLNAYTIDFDREFKLSLKPNRLQGGINISVHKNSEKEVLQKLAKYSNFISKYNAIKKEEGSYSVSPNYHYINNKRIKDGYRGSIYYKIFADNITNFNIFIEKLQNKKRDKNVNISISSVSWQLSPKQREGRVDNLRMRAIEWANSYAKRLSTKLKRECSVTQISFSPIRYPRPVTMAMPRVAMSKSDAPVPEQTTRNISIRPHIQLECK